MKARCSFIDNSEISVQIIQQLELTLETSVVAFFYARKSEIYYRGTGASVTLDPAYFTHQTIATRRIRRWVCPAVDNRLLQTASGTMNKLRKTTTTNPITLVCTFEQPLKFLMPRSVLFLPWGRAGLELRADHAEVLLSLSEGGRVVSVKGIACSPLEPSPCHSDGENGFLTQRLAHSPPTKANRVQFPTGSPDFRKWESCRMMPLVGGFSRGYPISPTPSFRRRSIFTSITLIGSQDLAAAVWGELLQVAAVNSVYPGPILVTGSCYERRESTPLIKQQLTLQHFSTPPVRSGVVFKLLASHPGKPGSIPGGVAPPDFRAAGIVPNDAAGRLGVFLVISRLPPPLAFRYPTTGGSPFPSLQPSSLSPSHAAAPGCTVLADPDNDPDIHVKKGRRCSSISSESKDRPNIECEAMRQQRRWTYGMWFRPVVNNLRWTYGMWFRPVVNNLRWTYGMWFRPVVNNLRWTYGMWFRPVVNNLRWTYGMWFRPVVNNLRWTYGMWFRPVVNNLRWTYGMWFRPVVNNLRWTYGMWFRPVVNNLRWTYGMWFRPVVNNLRWTYGMWFRPVVNNLRWTYGMWFRPVVNNLRWTYGMWFRPVVNNLRWTYGMWFRPVVNNLRWTYGMWFLPVLSDVGLSLPQSDICNAACITYECTVKLALSDSVSRSIRSPAKNALITYGVTAPVASGRAQKTWAGELDDVCLFHSPEIQLLPICVPESVLYSSLDAREHRFPNGPIEYNVWLQCNYKKSQPLDEGITRRAFKTANQSLYNVDSIPESVEALKEKLCREEQEYMEKGSGCTLVHVGCNRFRARREKVEAGLLSKSSVERGVEVLVSRQVFDCVSKLPYSERCRWSEGFLRDTPFPPPLRSDAAPYTARFTLIGCQDPVVRAAQTSSSGEVIMYSPFAVTFIFYEPQQKFYYTLFTEKEHAGQAIVPVRLPVQHESRGDMPPRAQWAAGDKTALSGRNHRSLLFYGRRVVGKALPKAQECIGEAVNDGQTYPSPYILGSMPRRQKTPLPVLCWPISGALLNIFGPVYCPVDGVSATVFRKLVHSCRRRRLKHRHLCCGEPPALVALNNNLSPRIILAFYPRFNLTDVKSRQRRPFRFLHQLFQVVATGSALRSETAIYHTWYEIWPYKAGNAMMDAALTRITADMVDLAFFLNYLILSVTKEIMQGDIHSGKEGLGGHGLHFGAMTTSLSVLRTSLNYEEQGKHRQERCKNPCDRENNAVLPRSGQSPYPEAVTEHISSEYCECTELRSFTESGIIVITLETCPEPNMLRQIASSRCSRGMLSVARDGGLQKHTSSVARRRTASFVSGSCHGKNVTSARKWRECQQPPRGCVANKGARAHVWAGPREGWDVGVGGGGAGTICKSARGKCWRNRQPCGNRYGSGVTARCCDPRGEQLVGVWKESERGSQGRGATARRHAPPTNHVPRYTSLFTIHGNLPSEISPEQLRKRPRERPAEDPICNETSHTRAHERTHGIVQGIFHCGIKALHTIKCTERWAIFPYVCAVRCTWPIRTCMPPSSCKVGNGGEK
ncbi:hypothetical protein PR048_019246 [Dryococelus australis]|uniref:Uncharacterized protein n=1 Tax=Dryococelus australis TaxID=614101 RepID=A0ABQ9H382_9NEOP|nr:hypothetical protein PR048_019246 [Dryococelus australis]